MDNLKAKKRHPEEIAVYTAIYVCAAFSEIGRASCRERV